MSDDELMALRVRLKSGEYNGADIMHAWLALDELVRMRKVAPVTEAASWVEDLAAFLRPIAEQQDEQGAAAEGLGQFLPSLRRLLAAKENQNRVLF